MRIIFIRPNMSNTKSSDAMHPLVFAILAAHTPSDIETVLYDDRIESIHFDEPTDLVAMSVETYTATRAYKIAATFKKRNIPVLMGGFHPTAMPDEALEHADSIVIGDAETIWEDVISDFRNGKLKRQYRSNPIKGEFSTKLDRSIFNNKKFAPINLVQWGRGCRHNCEFCSIKAFYGNNQCTRRRADVIDEIAELDKKPIFLVDDNLFHDRDSTILFLEALSELNVKWACQISIEVANDKTIMNLLQKSGCVAVLIGFESLNAENLLQMKKGFNNRVGSYSSIIKTFHDYGIMIYGTFVFGYDHDTKDSFKVALEFALKSKLFLANFNPLYPMPDTPLYYRLLSEKRLIHSKWWTDESFYYGKTIFQPKGMTAEELEEGCFYAKKKFNTYSSIFTRLTNFGSNAKNLNNLSLFMMANLTNRREIYKKQGADLG
jgi:radical SAM superfamily enzyme YgiQ (UPF0313 family)